MLSTALFRIFQEALTNIARHANAASVRTILHQEEDRIRLNVADDGIGITEDKLEQQPSFGLRGMRERVHNLHGKIEINTHVQKAPQFQSLFL